MTCDICGATSTSDTCNACEEQMRKDADDIAEDERRRYWAWERSVVDAINRSMRP